LGKKPLSGGSLSKNQKIMEDGLKEEQSLKAIYSRLQQFYPI
jgi:hypothetical protein